jgi:hypothetical protein
MRPPAAVTQDAVGPKTDLNTVRYQVRLPE